MKIAFISNYLTHHQIPLCLEMYSHVGENFKFISTAPMDQERMSMGWKLEGQHPFELSTYASQDSMKLCHQIADTWDVVVIGSAPDELIVSRLKKGLLTFKYSERFYKSGTPLKRLPRDIAGAWLHHGRYQKYPLYMLCASAYTAADAARFGNYKNRTFKWGYFPEVVQYENIEKILDAKRPASILWAGRTIEWKHPDVSILVAKRLRKAGYKFELNLIGNGKLQESLQNMIHDNRLDDCVHMLGAMKPEQVREYMEQSEIFLFTSDRNEGWGAVLNESMNSGCAVVASHEIGSVPFLIKDKENGLIYKDDNPDDLFNKIVWLINHPAERCQIGRRAYQTLTEQWNAENAAQRLLNLSQMLLNGERHPFPYKDGVCSKAEILSDGWYKSE